MYFGQKSHIIGSQESMGGNKIRTKFCNFIQLLHFSVVLRDVFPCPSIFFIN